MASSADPIETVRIKVLFFASAREAAGDVSQTEVYLTGDRANTAGIRHVLAQNYPKLAAMVLDEQSVTLALNEEYIPPGQVLPLQTGDTIALIPPISGG